MLELRRPIFRPALEAARAPLAIKALCIWTNMGVYEGLPLGLGELKPRKTVENTCNPPLLFSQELFGRAAPRASKMAPNACSR